MYYYGTNTQGSKWKEKYGAIFSKCIPNWKMTTYSRKFIEICNCIGIITTRKPLDNDIIKKYELIKLTKKQHKLINTLLERNN